MNSFNKDFFQPDGEGDYPSLGKYFVFNLSMIPGNFMDNYLDFAYFAVCEDAIGVLEVTGEDLLQVYTADNTSMTMTAEEFSNAYVFLNEIEAETEFETEAQPEIESEIESE